MHASLGLEESLALEIATKSGNSLASVCPSSLGAIEIGGVVGEKISIRLVGERDSVMLNAVAS